MATVLPISAIVPTIGRSELLLRTLESLARQSSQPIEMVIVDASRDRQTEQLCKRCISGLKTQLVYRTARKAGAAAQRNEGVSYAAHSNLLFMDDDILFEEDCLQRLWEALKSDDELGGVNATIINQQYSSPGLFSRILFRLLHGRYEASYAGKCIGPAFNLLAEDRDDLAEIVMVDWLNTTCTLYRKEALPNPPFADHFEGYSLMEDVALSLTVARDWKLANARTARIYHNSQLAAYKNNQTSLARMELINRHYVMTRVMNRTTAMDYAKLALLEVFGVVTPLVSARAWRSLPSVLLGKARGVGSILRQRGVLVHKGTALENGQHMDSGSIREAR
jgi:GT2 family glycosyltransferase